MRIIGLVITLAVVGVAAGNISAFIDIPSAIIVLGMSGGCLIFSRAGLVNMFSASFSATATADEVSAAARGWAQAKSYAIASGIIGTMIGSIIMLKLMEGTEGLAPGAALAALTILYSLILGYGVCLPMQSRLEDRARDLTR
jgi:hypothetical protein